MSEHNDMDQALRDAYQTLANDIRDRADMNAVKASLYERMRQRRPLPAPEPARTTPNRSGERPLPEARFLTVAEVAVMMRVSKMAVYRLVHAGELPAIRVGRSFRVPERAVHDYLHHLFDNARVV